MTMCMFECKLKKLNLVEHNFFQHKFGRIISFNEKYPQCCIECNDYFYIQQIMKQTCQ